MGERRRVQFDPAVAAILSGAADPPESSRQSKPRPHERDRTGRKMTVTFPDPAWLDAIQAEAERWGVRPSDVMVYAISVMMDAFEQGQARPSGEAQPYQRAGEGLDLPWEPGG